MPEYPIPPWLRPPPDPGEEYLSAFHTGAGVAAQGAQLSQENARLQFAQQQHQQDYMMRQQQFEIGRQQTEKEFLQKQQQIEIGQQQHNLEFGLKKQELEQQSALNQAKIQQASRQFIAQQTYQKRFDEYTAGGMDRTEASRRAILEAGPGMFPSPVGWAQVLKQLEPQAKVNLAPSVTYTDKGTELIQDYKGNIHIGYKQGAGHSSTDLTPEQRLRGHQQSLKELAGPPTPAEVAAAKRVGLETQSQAAFREKEEKRAKHRAAIDELNPYVTKAAPATIPPSVAPPTAAPAYPAVVPQAPAAAAAPAPAASPAPAPAPAGAYKTKEDVKAALKAKTISREEAVRILREQFADQF